MEAEGRDDIREQEDAIGLACIYYEVGKIATFHLQIGMAEGISQGCLELLAITDASSLLQEVIVGVGERG